MGFLDRQTVSSTVMPKKKKVLTQGGKEIQQVQRTPRDGVGDFVYTKPNYGIMTDTELTDYSTTLGKFMGGGATKEQARRAQAKVESDAAAQAAATNAARQEQQQALLNLQRETQNLSANSGADLTTSDGAAKIVAGGTADAQAPEVTALKKKKGTGLSSQLGVNV